MAQIRAFGRACISPAQSDTCDGNVILLRSSEKLLDIHQKVSCLDFQRRKKVHKHCNGKIWVAQQVPRHGCLLYWLPDIVTDLIDFDTFKAEEIMAEREKDRAQASEVYILLPTRPNSAMYPFCTAS
jgi:hypothetical protein